MGDQNGRCYICGREIDRDVEETNIDHIVPWRREGRIPRPISHLPMLVATNASRTATCASPRFSRSSVRSRRRSAIARATLADVLGYFGGSKRIQTSKSTGTFQGRVRGRHGADVPDIHRRTVGGAVGFIEVPIEYLFHDGLINREASTRALAASSRSSTAGTSAPGGSRSPRLRQDKDV